MFRTQANPMDDAIVKATDENLVNENWEYILDVCDKVSASPSGPQQAVASLIKRLAHRNANVQLYTLELANALSQNCGPPLHRELASRAFTEALLRLASDRNTHSQVKQKVMERMETWTEDFGKSPDFGIMGDAYRKLRTTQPSLQPPSKPGKREISSEDRKKEEDELQMALALSVQDNSKSKTNGTVRDDSEPIPQAAAASAASAATQSQGTTAATVSRVRALYDFTPSEAGELAFRKNDIIAVLESVYKDWWKGSLRGQTGIFPLNYVEKLQDPTKDELERDANMEAEVFGEIKNVERLLALLSVHTDGGSGRRGEREEEEISELYQRTLSIRPKLIELIGKYSQKKDDFTQLNEKFIKARRDYEALLESSMAHPHQYPQQYGGSLNRYPQQMQSPYAQQAGQYPQQVPSSGYASAPQQYAGVPPQQAMQHPQQDLAQRFYSPAPQAEPPQHQHTYPYPQGQQAPPPQQQQQQMNTPAAFHFIPGGVAPPPDQNLAIRRKPSPSAMSEHGPHSNAPPSEMGVSSIGTSYAGQPNNTFQGQIRPDSIHTLNSGAPQELATGGYESPVDRRSYPPADQQTAAPQQAQQRQYAQPHESFSPVAQTQPTPSAQSSTYSAYQQLPPHMQHQSAIPAPLQAAQRNNDLNSLPSRQRTQSFESSYSGATDPSTFTAAPSQHYPQQAAPSSTVAAGQGSHPQPSFGGSHEVPASAAAAATAQGSAYAQNYQPYHPGVQPQAIATAPPADDPGDYYR